MKPHGKGPPPPRGWRPAASPGKVRLLPRDEEYVPSPAAYLRAPRVPDLGAEPEFVAVLVYALRCLVVEVEAGLPERGQRVQLARPGEAVVVHVLPQPQGGEDRVAAVDNPVAVAAIRGLIVDG